MSRPNHLPGGSGGVSTLDKSETKSFERCLPSPCLSTTIGLLMIVTCGSDVCLHDTRVCLSFFPVLSILLHAPFVSIMFCFHHDRVRRRLQKALEDCTLSKDLQYVDL